MWWPDSNQRGEMLTCLLSFCLITMAVSTVSARTPERCFSVLLLKIRYFFFFFWFKSSCWSFWFAGDLKRICETDLGIVSQCFLTTQVCKKTKQYLANVAFKIDVKVGGRNTVLVDALSRRIPLVSDRPTIIFGADVTHPPPGEDSSPSITAVWHPL